MSAEQGYMESKTTTVKMQEPYQIKAVPYAKGYKIELKLNGDDYLADKMRIKEGPIIAMIREMKTIIKEELNSKVLEDVD